jgi:hypothetical protein
MNGNTMAGKEREKCYWIIVINSGVDKAPADPTAQRGPSISEPPRCMKVLKFVMGYFGLD